MTAYLAVSGLLMAYLIVDTIRALVTGRARIIVRTVKRSENPIQFWWAILLGGGAGVAGLIAIVVLIESPH